MSYCHRNVYITAAVALKLWLASCCFGDAPGFRRIQITNTPDDIELNPMINNLGHIVWSSRIGGIAHLNDEEIYLYANGETTRLTTDSVHDTEPDINDDDVVVWSRFSGRNNEYGPTGEIVRWTNGTLDYLTDNKLSDVGPRINNDGRIVWYELMNTGCGGGADARVELFDGSDIVDLTDGSHPDQVPVSNYQGYVVWTRYNFCKRPWVSAVLMRDLDGNIAQLSEGFEPQAPNISPTGTVAWSDGDVLYEWYNGVAEKITADGTNPHLNSRGDIAFERWNNDRQLWETWLYLGGEFRQIAADDGFTDIVYDMNERGDIVIGTHDAGYAHAEIVLYERLPSGDMNCDEQVNFDDIDGFVDAITDRATYEANYPNCDWWLADCNGDRHVDFNDIDAFVTCLINNGCP